MPKKNAPAKTNKRNVPTTQGEIEADAVSVSSNTLRAHVHTASTTMNDAPILNIIRNKSCTILIFR